MNKINLLMVIAFWAIGHVLVYNTHHYLIEMYAYNVSFMLMLFFAAAFIHYCLFSRMISKISTYL